MSINNLSDVSISYHKGVATIALNRPDKLNAVRLNTYDELIAALRQADDSPECNVIILQGVGGNFTAGNDLSDLVDGDPQRIMECVQGIFGTIAGLNKVAIGVVEGVAVGIGTTILLHCDLVVASKAARFRVPFANLGGCPEGGSSLLLPLAIGDKMAREVLLTGRFFTAQEALQWGLVNRLSEPGQAREVAEEYISLLLAQPLESLIVTKKLIKSHRPELDRVISEELEEFSRLLQTKQTQQRIKAILKM